ncbi:hypothetical protein HNR06_005211 [Nocardiopsis arvandica]|uniref:Uncharacterized protein n=1 Tax=Nocardiopsis sinuspersici TaxID=501010 RepID=A0A7Z0BNI9_9ACTN|nr:hypothetical protein [Nocardiopsis sinuspersici]NYH55622.1 hypothetical protein [Nocardiopsis sinuspersici]
MGGKLYGQRFSHFSIGSTCVLKTSGDQEREGASSTGNVDLSPIELASGHHLVGVPFLEDAVSPSEGSGEIDPVSRPALPDL